MSVTHSRRGSRLPWLAGALVLLMGLPGLTLGGFPTSALPTLAVAPAGSSLAPLPATNSTLTVNTSSVNLSGDFFGTTINNEVRLLRGETDAVNATPAHVLVWPGAMAGDGYDPLTNTHYDIYSSNSRTALTGEVQFINMCRAIHCTAIMQLPAEIDNPSYAEKIVNYTERNLSFVPAYWMIGNEPELWGQWQVPWKNWGSSTTGGPTPAQFGAEVLAYVNVIRQVDNTTPILGLPASGCTCGSWTFEQWIEGVLNVTGSKIQAVAFHEYPAGWLGTGDGSLLDFYGTLQSAASIPPRVAGARAAVQAVCPKCNVSVMISELGSALSWSAYGQYAAGFSGALSVASQITQAMDVNLTNIDLFATELATLNSWFSPNGYARPDYALYTQVLNHLGTQAFSVSASGLSHTVYAIDTIAPNDGGRRDLLVMNDNITHNVSFVPQFAEAPRNSSVEAWTWNGTIHNTGNDTWVEPATPTPVPHEYPGGLPRSYVLPPQSLVLFEEYPSGGSYVRVNESGVPNGTSWYANVGTTVHRVDGPNLTLLLPNGSYPLSSAGIPLPVGGKERVPLERLEGYAASDLRVEGAPANATLNFVPQWRVNVSVAPNGTVGTVGPPVAWWNQSQPLTLSVAPAHGFAFVRWGGYGPGNYSGPARTITVVPNGPIVERAQIVPGDAVYFVAMGLPTGTPWSVTVHSFTTNGSSPILTAYVRNGSFGYSVGNVSGYRILPRNGAGYAGPGYNLVHVRFVKITPPQAEFPVVFQVAGLPSSMAVPITVRGSTSMTGATVPAFQLINGTYAYKVGYVAGYHALAPLKLFNVTGGPVTVIVRFVPTVFPTHWEAVGVPKGLNWSVDLNGTDLAGNSSWISTDLANGSYSYSIVVPSNYTVSPRTGTVGVNGFASVLSVSVQLAMYSTKFVGVGLDPSAVWSVRLGNATLQTSAGGLSFLAANDTYTFDVHPPDGFYAVPSHGNVTVAGVLAPVRVVFHPVSSKPSAALVAALSSGALTVSVWVGVSIAGGFVIPRWLRRRSG